MCGSVRQHMCVCVFFLHTLYATVWARWRWWWSCVRVLRAQSPLKIKRRVCSRASSARAASIGGFLSHSVWRRRRRRQLLLDCARRWRARHNVNIICYTHPRWLAVCQTQFEYKRFSNAELVGYLLQICEYIYILNTFSFNGSLRQKPMRNQIHHLRCQVKHTLNTRDCQFQRDSIYNISFKSTRQ